MNTNAQDFVADGGRIIRRRKGRRTITIAYKQIEAPSGLPMIKYGATIHRQDSTRDQFDRKAHNQTAILRLENCPVIVMDPKNSSVQDRENYIRRCLVTHGCFTDDQTWLHPASKASQ